LIFVDIPHRSRKVSLHLHGQPPLSRPLTSERVTQISVVRILALLRSKLRSASSHSPNLGIHKRLACHPASHSSVETAVSTHTHTGHGLASPCTRPFQSTAVWSRYENELEFCSFSDDASAHSWSFGNITSDRVYSTAKLPRAWAMALSSKYNGTADRVN